MEYYVAPKREEKYLYHGYCGAMRAYSMQHELKTGRENRVQDPIIHLQEGGNTQTQIHAHPHACTETEDKLKTNLKNRFPWGGGERQKTVLEQQ